MRCNKRINHRWRHLALCHTLENIAFFQKDGWYPEYDIALRQVWLKSITSTEFDYMRITTILRDSFSNYNLFKFCMHFNISSSKMTCCNSRCKITVKQLIYFLNKLYFVCLAPHWEWFVLIASGPKGTVFPRISTHALIMRPPPNKRPPARPWYQKSAPLE